MINYFNSIYFAAFSIPKDARVYLELKGDKIEIRYTTNFRCAYVTFEIHAMTCPVCLGVVNERFAYISHIPHCIGHNCMY